METLLSLWLELSNDGNKSFLTSELDVIRPGIKSEGTA